MRLKAAAKVNLSLDVTGKLENGYHLIESFFQTVGLYDVIDIELNDSREISLTCSDKTIPCNESNIAYKAALIFREKSGIDFGCKIHLRKTFRHRQEWAVEAQTGRLCFMPSTSF